MPFTLFVGLPRLKSQFQENPMAVFEALGISLKSLQIALQEVNGIPMVSGVPNLLYYKLGTLQLTALPDVKTLVLPASSGSGKTRAILEKFSRTEGFFFVAEVRDNGGSADFPIMLGEFYQGIHGKTQEQDQNAMEIQFQFRFLLRCRSLVYDWLKSLKPGLSALEWLLVQLYPSQFFSSKVKTDVDIFVEIFKHLPTNFQSEMKDFPVAIDEAQILVTVTNPPLFLGEVTKSPRPILTKLVQAVDQNVLVIVAGTSSEMQYAASHLASGRKNPQAFRDFVVYQSASDMWRYVCNFLPAEAKDYFEKNVAPFLVGRARFLQIYCEQCLQSTTSDLTGEILQGALQTTVTELSERMDSRLRDYETKFFLADAIYDFHFSVNVARIPLTSSRDIFNSGLVPTNSLPTNTGLGDSLAKIEIQEPMILEVLTERYVTSDSVLVRAQKLGSEKGFAFENVLAFSLRSLGANFTPIDFLDIPEDQKKSFLGDDKVPEHWRTPIKIRKRELGSPIVRVCQTVEDMHGAWEENELMKPPESVGPDLALPINLGGKKVLLSIQAKLWVSEEHKKSEVTDAVEKSSPFTYLSRLKAKVDQLQEKAKTTTLSPAEKGQLTKAGGEIPHLESFKTLVGNVDNVGCLRLVVISSTKDFFGDERLLLNGNDLVLFVGQGDLSQLVGGKWKTYWTGLLQDKQRSAETSSRWGKRKLEEEGDVIDPRVSLDEEQEEEGEPPKKIAPITVKRVSRSVKTTNEKGKETE